MAVLGKNIIENLTTGMYEDSNIIYREYIQNSADQIVKAINQGILTPEEAIIDIDINKKTRCITIYDNATGIPVSDFKQKLSDIANSDKNREENAGFRGIGRLGGIAYCDTLVFSSSFYGEKTKSIMYWDAKKCREILSDVKKRPTALELLDFIITYEEETCDLNEHFFEVQLKNIKEENVELMDKAKVREYLSFVAPLPFSNKFLLRSKIYTYIKNENFPMNEYKILINGTQLFKEYGCDLYEGTAENRKKYDEISDLEFRKIVSPQGELLAWMWFGISKFEKQIPTINDMRGIRLRQSNIQIGDTETFSYPKFYKEARGNLYFVGEVHALHYYLIPNARRDYFNENITRLNFEDTLRPIMYTELHKLYHFANEVKNAFVKKAIFVEKQIEFNEKVKSGAFIDDEEIKSASNELEKQEVAAEDATKKLNLRNENAESNPVLRRVFNTLQEEYKKKAHVPKLEKVKKSDRKYLTQGLPKLNNKERKLISQVYAIINKVLPKDEAEMMIKKIQEELSK